MVVTTKHNMGYKRILVTAGHYFIRGTGIEVVFWGRDSNGKRAEITIRGKKPYFYTDKAVSSSLVTKVVENAGVTLKGERVHKIYVRHPVDVKKIREKYNIRTWEADVPFVYRVWYDLGVGTIATLDNGKILPGSGDIKPRVVYMDIEVYDLDKFPSPESASYPVTAITCYDNYTDQYTTFYYAEQYPSEILLRKLKEENLSVRFVRVQDERELFLRWSDYIKEAKPDIITGWNVEDYDILYLKNRSKNEMYPMANLTGIQIFDLMVGYLRLKEGEIRAGKNKKALEYVAMHELGRGKVRKEGKKVEEIRREDLDKFLYYNLIDVNLCVELEEKMGILGFFLEECKVAGIFLEDVFYPTKIADAMLFRALRGKYVLPSRKTLREMKELEKIETGGGYVGDPVEGVFRWVCVVDLKSEYPSLIRTFNLSPEMVVERPGPDVLKLPCELKTGEAKEVYVLQKPRGILPTLLEKMLEERDAVKRERDKYPVGSREYKVLDYKQRVLKEINNSMYGMLKNPTFRLSNPLLSGVITTLGRRHVQWVREKISEMGGIPLYSDTDSCFFYFPGLNEYEEVKKKALGVERTLNESFQEFTRQFGVEEHHLRIKLEKIFSAWFQSGSKKRYVGRAVWMDGRDLEKPKDVVRGFDIRRSNTSEYTQWLLEKVFGMILSGSGKEEILQFVEKEKERFRRGEIHWKQVGIPQGIGIPLDRYKKKGQKQHIKAAIWSNENLGKNFTIGDKPYLYFVKGLPHPIALEWDEEKWPDGVELDWERQMRRCILLPLGPILSALGVGEVGRNKKKRNKTRGVSLDVFMKSKNQKQEEIGEKPEGGAEEKRRAKKNWHPVRSEKNVDVLSGQLKIWWTVVSKGKKVPLVTDDVMALDQLKEAGFVLAKTGTLSEIGHTLSVPLDGEVVDILVYDGKLGERERKRLEKYADFFPPVIIFVPDVSEFEKRNGWWVFGKEQMESVNFVKKYPVFAVRVNSRWHDFIWENI